MRKIVFLCILILISSCGAKNTYQAGQADTPQAIQAEIYLMDTPNDIYKPGDVLIRDKKTGGLDKFTSVKEPGIKDGKAVMRNQKISKDNNLNSLFNFLGIEKFPIVFTPSVMRTKKMDINFSSEDVDQYYLNDLLELREKVKNLNQIMSKELETFNIDLRKKQLILLTNVYSSSNVTYTVDVGRTKRDTLSIGFKEIAASNSGIKVSDTSNVSLVYNRDKPLGFAYKKIDLGVRRGADGKTIYVKR